MPQRLGTCVKVRIVSLKNQTLPKKNSKSKLTSKYNILAVLKDKDILYVHFLMY